MLKTSKIAISLPGEDFNRLEKIRKKLKMQRSAIIDKAIRFWLGHLEKNEIIKRYEDGYRKKPEHIDEVKAMESASAEAFGAEEWK